MRVFQERNLQVTFVDEVDAWKFDDESHGLSHCMKAVDFIVELPDSYLFIEFKDPEHPDAPQANRDSFIQEFTGGKLDEDCKYKYRDSFLYEWASGRVDKPVHFFLLVADESLDDVQLTTRMDALARVLPLNGPKSGVWTKRIVEGCAVFNIASWNRHFPLYPLNRVEP